VIGEKANGWGAQKINIEKKQKKRNRPVRSRYPANFARNEILRQTMVLGIIEG